MTSKLSATELSNSGKQRAAAATAELTAANTAITAATTDSARQYALRRKERATEALRQANLFLV